MSQIPMYDPGTSEVQSPLIAGLSEACSKFSKILGTKTGTLENFPLKEVYIQENDRYRIYQAPIGNKLWMPSPEPIFYKNGSVITPDDDGFTIDYVGGSIIFDNNKRLTADDIITIEAAYIIPESDVIESFKSELYGVLDKIEHFKGYFDNYEDLIEKHATGKPGDYAIVCGEENRFFIWAESDNRWIYTANEYNIQDLSISLESAKRDIDDMHLEINLAFNYIYQLDSAVDKLEEKIESKPSFVVQDYEPSNTSVLWIDTNPTNGGLKFYNNGWRPVISTYYENGVYDGMSTPEDSDESEEPPL